MSFTDFGNNLSQSTYLSPQNATNPDLAGSVADIERFVIPAQIENTLKEIVCGLAGGGGLKLPNKQICINHAINSLLGEIAGMAQGLISDALQSAISALQGAFQNFMNHLNLDSVLGRINGLLGQISNLANMINFCSAPVDPIQIPNVLENAMGSFLGKGLDIMNKIGSIPTPNIGGCTAGGFNPGIFDGGVLKTIGDNLDDLGPVEDAIIADIEEIIDDINDLIDNETNVPTEYDTGGSNFLEGDRPVWDGVSVLFNPQDEGISGAIRNGSALWSAYQQLGSYQVQDLDGNTYNNIFELFVDDDLLRLLRRSPNPQPDIVEREPILNYCGETVGFREIVKQREPQTSRGSVPVETNQPGFNAGGLPTNPLTAAINELANAAGGSVTNNITNITNIDGVRTFADEDALLAANTTDGQIVFVQDTNTVYFDNGGTTGTLADYTPVGGSGTGGGGTSLNSFLDTINNGTGTGVVTRSGNSVFYRDLQGTSQEITISNSNGVGGNPTIRLANNPRIPGNGSIIIPNGSTGDRNTTDAGAFRYNTTINAFEGFQGGAWQQFATGASGVIGGSNVGGGTYEIFRQNNGGTLEFRTISATGAISISQAGSLLTVTDSLTATNLGSGAEVFKERVGNDLRYRSLTAGSGVTITENTDDIEITSTGSGTSFDGTISTVNNTATEVLFGGVRRTPPADKSWFFTITAVANRTNASDATAIKLEGLFDNNSGTVTIVGTAGNKTVYNSTPATSGYDLLVDIVSNQVRVRIQGDTGHDVDWRVRYEYIEA